MWGACTPTPTAAAAAACSAAMATTHKAHESTHSSPTHRESALHLSLLVCQARVFEAQRRHLGLHHLCLPLHLRLALPLLLPADTAARDPGTHVCGCECKCARVGWREQQQRAGGKGRQGVLAAGVRVHRT